MISGHLHRRRDWPQFGVALLFACGVANSLFAQSLELPELLSAMGRVERSSATFEETRYLGVLATPIVRRGTLRYDRPDRLLMVVQTPTRERVEIRGEELTLESRGEIKTARVSEFPMIAAWIESVRATLAGDQRTLGRYFRIAVSGRMSGWTLELTPLGTGMGAVSRITIAGSQAQIARIEITEQGGDRSLMTIAPVDQKP